MIEPGWITRHPIQGFPKQQHIQKYPSKYQKYVFKGHLGMVWSNWNHSKRASQAEPRRLQRHRPETICLTYQGSLELLGPHSVPDIGEQPTVHMIMLNIQLLISVPEPLFNQHSQGLRKKKKLAGHLKQIVRFFFLITNSLMYYLAS